MAARRVGQHDAAIASCRFEFCSAPPVTPTRNPAISTRYAAAATPVNNFLAKVLIVTSSTVGLLAGLLLAVAAAAGGFAGFLFALVLGVAGYLIGAQRDGDIDLTSLVRGHRRG